MDIDLAKEGDNYQVKVSKAATLDQQFLSSLNYAAVLQQGIFPKDRHFDRIFKIHHV